MTKENGRAGQMAAVAGVVVKGVVPVENKGKIRAVAEVELAVAGGGTVTLPGLRVLDGPKGLFVGMPSVKIKPQGDQEGGFALLYSLTGAAKGAVNKAVLEEYARVAK